MAVVQPQKTDVFPVSVVPFTRNHILPRHPNFKLASTSKKNNMIPFIISIIAKTVYYFPLNLTVAARKHFWDTGKNLDPTKYLPLLDWGYMANRLTRTVTGIKHNHDVRTCFKFKNNYFLVKKCFTFGLRTVEKGTHHLYQMGCVPMAFYLLEGRKGTHRHEKMFVPDHQFAYRKMTWQSGKNYRIPEGTRYVVCATTYTFFAVHIISSDAVLPFQTHNPVLILGKKQANPSKSPPTASRPDLDKTSLRTPMIESVWQNDLEDKGEGESERPYPSDPGPSSVGTGSNPSTWMPPPPLPPQQSSIPIIQDMFLPTIPFTKVIHLIHPDNLQWYRGMQKPLYHDPKTTFKPFDAPDESSAALDLSLPKVTSGMTVEDVQPPPPPPPAGTPLASPTGPQQLEPSWVDFAPLPSLMTALSPWATPYDGTETPTTGGAPAATAAFGLSNATTSPVVSCQPSPLPCWTTAAAPDAATLTQSVSQQPTGSLPAPSLPVPATCQQDTSAVLENRAFGNSHPSGAWTAPEATQVPLSTGLFSVQQPFQQPTLFTETDSPHTIYYVLPKDSSATSQWSNGFNMDDEMVRVFLNNL